MKKSSQLSAVLHALLHMAQRDAPMTSEALAQCLDTNPVVVRRTMAGLREAGFVASARGHSGGWTLTKPLDAVTLFDVHAALGEPALFRLGIGAPDPACLVERAVNNALDGAMREAEALLVRRLSEITLADIAGDFMAHFSAPSPPPEDKV